MKDKKNVVIGLLVVVVLLLTVVLAVILMGKNKVQGTDSGMVSNQTIQGGDDSNTSEPVVTEEPADLAEATDVPAATAEPEKGEPSEGTNEPEKTETPEVTDTPEKTEVPEVTDAPEKTEAPEETKKPEKTDAPEKTEAPQVTEAPKPTKVPVSDGKLSPLKLDGTQLCDADGNPVQLRGISTHGLGWFPQYVNEECFKQFKEEWDMNVVRLAMYTAENAGYCTDGNKDKLKQLVKDGVSYATNQGLYVIIDWHILSDNNPNTYKSEAKAFFEEMSGEYKDYTNVIYEICNEPNGGTGWRDVKSYAEEIIGVIRENDEDAIIIVGTPNWCQYVDQAASDPIKSSENIMYALHFYAATHTDHLRTQMKNAVNNGLPIFVSEYGICDASGNGGIDYNQANAWVDAMDDLGISYVAWNLSNKNETSAILKSSCNKVSGFEQKDLSDSGKWLYEMLTGKDPAGFTPSNTDDGSGNQPDNQGGADTQPTPAPTKAPTANISTGEGLAVAAEERDSWESPEGKNCNYNLTITNNSGKDVDGWSIVIKFSENITAVQGWSGNFTIEGSSLRISNVDYNGKIAAGDSVKDIGFIVTGGSNMKIVE